MSLNLKILYLIQKDIYITKLSRVRFHAIEALSSICDLTIWGPGWNHYNIEETLEYNLNYINGNFNFIIVYKPEHLIEFDKVKIKSCITYNEMWDESYTLNEINLSKCDIIICHHENDLNKYVNTLNKKITHYTKLIHIPHCAKKEIFYDRKLPKNIDILLCGSIGRHYPLRQRLRNVSDNFPSKYVCKE